MSYPFADRVKCMNIIRRVAAIDPWFASYALELALVELDIEKVNEITKSMVAMSTHPKLTGEDRIVALMRERFGIK